MLSVRAMRVDLLLLFALGCTGPAPAKSPPDNSPGAWSYESLTEEQRAVIDRDPPPAGWPPSADHGYSPMSGGHTTWWQFSGSVPVSGAAQPDAFCCFL